MHGEKKCTCTCDTGDNCAVYKIPSFRYFGVVKNYYSVVKQSTSQNEIIGS